MCSHYSSLSHYYPGGKPLEIKSTYRGCSACNRTELRSMNSKSLSLRPHYVPTWMPALLWEKMSVLRSLGLIMAPEKKRVGSYSPSVSRSTSYWSTGLPMTTSSSRLFESRLRLAAIEEGYPYRTSRIWPYTEGFCCRPYTCPYGSCCAILD